MDKEIKYIVDIMTQNPVVIGPDAPAWYAEQLAETRGVHDLLVIDGYRLVGVVCWCDLYDVDASTPVRERMRRPVTIDDQETALAAAELMDKCAVGCLPVVDWSGDLRGVLTRRDLRAASVLADEQVRSCASCGTTHGLCKREEDEQVAFCVRCIEQARPPQETVDELYFTLGGGD